MQEKPKKITIRDKNQNVKNVQEYKYNGNGDPILFIKKDEEGKILIHWIYEYEYDEYRRKTKMKISDIQTTKETIMNYEY